eukprot:TRINITY_DN74129_c0_g1_i1.p1 TRINITY_DN74129_c0_g1~~TRINITY_DN74129_c0_g1_i1.p1  ORF type:complete len:271 (+),score=23.78 TRINITY_DN74129_c0_g1_i1:70-882(+)
MASVALLEAGSKDAEAPKLWCGCIDCNSLLSWRANTGNRQCYKVLSSCGLATIMSVYVYSRQNFPVMLLIGVLFFLKNMVAVWGQDTPTFIVPGSPALFCLFYFFGIPSAIWIFAGCPASGEISFRYREIVGLVLFVFGTIYSFAYEFGRFQWKKLPENKGRCHTIGLASLSIHPNYFGDLFAYNGWAIAGGSMCAFSISWFQMGMFLWFVIPNADAYLAQRYQKDFPAYAAKTAPLIPFLRSPLVNQIIAWVGFLGSMYAGMQCTAHCS